jgi:hypothetical protein
MTEEEISSDLQAVWKNGSGKAGVCNSEHLLHKARALCFKCDEEDSK